MGPPRGPRASGVIYEVFRQERKGQPFTHAGSVEAKVGRGQARVLARLPVG